MSRESQCLIAYASLSHVHRLKRRLWESGVFVDMVRAPQCLGVRGCSFALRCAPALVPQIRELSRQLSIEVRGVFLETAAGYSPLP
jgi:hypothetical protein